MIDTNKKIPINSNLACPCFSGKPYSECCKPFHSGSLPIEPVQLMRSRYSAYALKLADYIMDTTDPQSPYYEKNRSKWKENILDFGNLEFTGLDILDAKDETVTFKAHLKQANQDISFTEKSLFTHKSNKWFYLKALKIESP